MVQKVVYKDWVSELQQPLRQVYIVTGAEIWTQSFLDSLKRKYKASIIDIDQQHPFQVVSQQLSYKNLRTIKNVAHYNITKKLSGKEYDTLWEYIKNPSKHAVLIISIHDWRVKRAFFSRFSTIKDTKFLKIFDLDFPSKHFVDSYIRSLLAVYPIEFETPAVKKFFTERIYTAYNTIHSNITKLYNLERTITLDIVKDFIEDETTVNYSKFFDSVIHLDTKKVPYNAYMDLINSGKKESTIIINLRKHLLLLYQAKYLKLKGFLRKDDNIEKQRTYFESKGIQFSPINIWNEPNFKINKYLEQSDSVSLRELVMMLCIVDKNINVDSLISKNVSSDKKQLKKDANKKDEVKQDAPLEVLNTTETLSLSPQLDSFDIKIATNMAVFELLYRRNILPGTLKRKRKYR